LAEGHFAAHLRRQRRLYRARQECALAAAARHLAGLLEVPPDPGGLHLVGYLTPELARRMDDREASRRAAAAGIGLPALSAHWSGRGTSPAGRQGLLIGYATLPEKAIEPAIARLAQVLQAPT